MWNIFQFSYMTSISLAHRRRGPGRHGHGRLDQSSRRRPCCAVGAICYGAFLKGRLGGFDLPIALLALEAIGFCILTHMVTVPGYYAMGTILYGLRRSACSTRR